MPKTLASAAKVGLEGQSFAPLLRGETRAHKQLGFHQYICASDPEGYSAVPPPPPPFGCMGYGVLSSTLRIHYIAWVAFNSTRLAPNFSRPFASELYDHRVDVAEDRNVVTLPAYSHAATQLRRALIDHFGKNESGPLEWQPSTAPSAC